MRYVQLFSLLVVTANVSVAVIASTAQATDFTQCFDKTGKNLVTTESVLRESNTTIEETEAPAVRFSINSDAYVRTTFVCGKAANPKSYEASWRVSYFLPKSNSCRTLITQETKDGVLTDLWRVGERGARLMAVNDPEKIGSIRRLSVVSISLAGLEQEPLFKLFDFGRRLTPLSIDWETLKVKDREVGLSDYEDNYHRKGDGYRYSYCRQIN